jgi:hypothetical protein
MWTALDHYADFITNGLDLLSVFLAIPELIRLIRAAASGLILVTAVILYSAVLTTFVDVICHTDSIVHSTFGLRDSLVSTTEYSTGSMITYLLNPAEWPILHLARISHTVAG